MSVNAWREKAKKAWMSGKYDLALTAFEELHRMIPNDLRIFVKLAETREKVGDKDGAVSDYTSIAENYANNGFVVQAIAISKIILRIDPNRSEIQDHLRSLSEKRGDDWAIRTLVPQDYQAVMATHEDRKFNFERTPLLSMLSGNELGDFIDSLSLTIYQKGEVIYQPGDSGENLYLIGMGSVRLDAKTEAYAHATYASLIEGDFFGEVAFMSRTLRVDTAIADSKVNILTIKRDIFDDWVASYPNIQTTVESFYCERVLARVLAVSPMFKDIPVETRLQLTDYFKRCHYKTGEEVIAENDASNAMYLIRSGHVKVIMTNPKIPHQYLDLGEIHEGSFFGEVSLLTGKPRTASVIAACPLELMELSQADFERIIERFPDVKRVVTCFQKKRVQDTIRTMMERQ